MRRRMLLGGTLAVGTAAATAVAIPRAALAAPAADLWPRWEAHRPNSPATVDHASWQAFLDRYRRPGPDGIARVAYAAVGQDDRARLDGYLAMLQGIDVDGLDRPEQRAFWTNFYNAGTVQVVLDHWPVDTIRAIDISPGLFANGPWGAKLWQVAGEALSLDDIEHRILRPIWRDPLIHYTVNCAALGCPDLPPTAFTGANMTAEAERLATAFAAHPRAVRRDDRDRLVVNSIFHWFEADFGGSEQGVLAHLRHIGGASVVDLLAGRHDYDAHAYDWAINAAAIG